MRKCVRRTRSEPDIEENRLGVHEPTGSLGYVVGDDLERLVRAAVALPEATHFAAVGSREAAKWFHPAARTREVPFVDEPELPGPDDSWERLVGCRLDAVARESVVRFVMKCSLRPTWPGAVLWHWWLYSDDHVVFSAYDWPWFIWLEPGLSAWAEQRLADGLLESAPDPDDFLHVRG